MMQRGEDVTEFAFLEDIRLNKLACLSRNVWIKKRHTQTWCASSIKIQILITSLALPSSLQPSARRS